MNDYVRGLVWSKMISLHIMNCKEADRDVELADHPVYKAGFIDGCLSVYAAIEDRLTSINSQTGTENHERDSEATN